MCGPARGRLHEVPIHVEGSLVGHGLHRLSKNGRPRWSVVRAATADNACLPVEIE